MSKNIVIQEAGLPQSLTVDALRLKKQGGGTEDWLPADGKNLVELQIGGSGTYKASDYNAYGISVARVKPKYGGGATSKAAEYDFTEKHTPSIKEGGKGRNFSAAMLKTNLQGGGTCLWVPKMDVVLKNKYISKSGTYTAKADDCYGFDQVVVSGVDVEITQDDDGDDVARITDGGEVTEEKLPDKIVIEREPYFTGPYGDHAYISFDGLIVKAYTKSGALWTEENHTGGIIPISELFFPVTVTDVGQASGSSEYDVTGLGLNEPVYLASVRPGDVWSRFTDPITIVKQVTGNVLVMRTKDSIRNYMVCVARFPGCSIDIERENGSFPDTYYLMREGTIDGKTFYYGTPMSSAGDMGWTWPISANQPMDIATAAGIALLGGHPKGWTQNVPVQWYQPYTGNLLETSFDVSLVDVSPN